MDIKISVIIPTCRRPRLLINCLNALAAQSIPAADFEVIVVSDGPDRYTTQALAAWPKPEGMNLLVHAIARKSGPAAARNHGWLKARAPLVAFTDDDCLPDPAWLQAFLRAATGHQYRAFTGRTHVPVGQQRTDFAMNLARLETADFITANCACTRDALMAVGGFDERFKMAWREDSDLQFKFILHHIPVVKVQEALVVHPVRDVPWGISIREQKKGAYDALLYKKYPKLYKAKINESIGAYYIKLGLLAMVIFSSYYHWETLTWLSAIALGFMLIRLILRRLQNRARNFRHVAEMVSTSLLIPFLSIFWRWYGAVKYRVFFI